MKKRVLNKKIKLAVASFACLLTISSAMPKNANAESSKNQNNWQYNELYRNQYHYSAAKNWLNDPNGLLYDDSTNTYHMYYQYNPNANGWGDMSWGHSTSKDLINWEEQPVAIEMLEQQDEMKFEFEATSGEFAGQKLRYWGKPRSNWDGDNGKKYIFSGSTVLDKENVTGLGENTILAYYTSCFQIPTRIANDGEGGLGDWIGIREVQEQHLAYSCDGGQTFIQYDAEKSTADNLAGNANRNSPKAVIPVTAISGLAGVDAKDFRDPKVVYDEEHNQWLMIVVTGQYAMIFKSDNLIDWEYASSIERKHDVGNGVWECPELIPMKDGNGNIKWILTMSVQDGAYASGSGMQYFVGDMDENGVWTPATEDTLAKPNWLDYGEDFYAGVTFGNTGDRKIMLAWESNWVWTGLQQTTPWYSNMTIPRELKLVADASYNGGYKIVQEPVSELDQQNGQEEIVPELDKGSGSLTDASGVKLTGDMFENNAAKVTNYKGTNYKIEAEFEWDGATQPDSLGMYLRGSDDLSRKLLVGYDFNPQLAFFNMLSTEDSDIRGAQKNGVFVARDKTNVFIPNTGKIKLTALVDESSMEIFINDGEKTITQVYYFRPENIGEAVTTDNIAFFVNGAGKEATVKNVKITPYRSIFGDINITTNDTPITYGGAIDLEKLVSASNTSGTGEVSTIESVNLIKGLANNAIGTHEVVYSATNNSGKYQEKTLKIKVVADKAELKAKIDEAEAIVPNEVAYTEDTWSAFKTKLDAAKASYDSTDESQTQEAVTTAKDELAAVIADLTFKVDKTALNGLIELVNQLNESEYTTASWDKMETLKSAGKEISAKLEATQEEVDSAFNKLFKSVQALELKSDEVPIDKSILELTLELYATVEANQANYTDDTWTEVALAKEAAQSVYENQQATQKQVDSAAVALANAIKKLEIKDVEEVASVSYSTHIQNIGWQNTVSDGQKAGTSGKALRLEALKINIDGGSSGGIEYMTHVQNLGDQKWVKNGAISGTSGKALRLEALKIRLTGELKEKYDVYYRVHVQTQGNQKWVKNSELAGTTGKALRLEAVQICLVKKGDPAPSNNLPF